MEKDFGQFLTFPVITIVHAIVNMVLFPVNWFLILTNQPTITFVIPL